MKRYIHLNKKHLAITERERNEGYVFTCETKPISDHNPFLIIMASVNGSEMLPFVFDTGSVMALAINKNYKNKLNIEMLKEKLDVGKGSVFNRIKPCNLIIRSATSLDFESDIEFAYVGEMKSLDEFYGKGKIAGIIGGDLTHFFKLYFNMEKNYIKIGYNCKEEDIFDDFNDIENLKMKIIKESWSSICPVIQFNLDNVNINALLRTASTGTCIQKKLLPEFKNKKSSKIYVANTNISGNYESNSYLLSDVKIFNKYIDSLMIDTVDSEKQSYLGLNVLNKFNFYMDYKSGDFIARKNKNKSGIKGYSGFDVGFKDGKYAIMFISEKYNGSVKLNIGDEIVLDGDYSLINSYFAAQYCLNGYVNVEKEMKIKRNGKILKVKYIPSSMFD